MQSSIKLSIIIPVYNVEKYLNECLDSVIEANIENTEIILVNDGSTDNSREICESYSQKYDFIKLVNQENGGLSAARNTGIQKAEGDYLWFVDSDDFIEKNSILNIFKQIEKNVDIIFTSYRRVYPDNSTFEYKAFNEDDNFDVEPFEYLYLLGNVSYAAVRFIVKKELLIKNNIFFLKGIYHEDEEWTPRIICKAKSFGVVMDIVYNYRVGNPNSIIGKPNAKKVKDKIFICTRFNKLLKNNLSDKKKKFIISRIVHNYIGALNEYSIYSKETRKELKQLLKENFNLLSLSNSKKAKMVKSCIIILGIDNTSKLLRLRNANK